MDVVEWRMKFIPMWFWDKNYYDCLGVFISHILSYRIDVLFLRAGETFFKSNKENYKHRSIKDEKRSFLLVHARKIGFWNVSVEISAKLINYHPYTSMKFFFNKKLKQHWKPFCCIVLHISISKKKFDQILTIWIENFKSKTKIIDEFLYLVHLCKRSTIQNSERSLINGEINFLNVYFSECIHFSPQFMGQLIIHLSRALSAFAIRVFDLFLSGV